MLLRSLRQQALFLDLRAESSGHSPSSDDRPGAVVALRAIAAARARPNMIPEAVRDPVAQGAITIRACDGKTEPHAEKHAKKGSIQVKPKGFRRPGQQPRPGARLLKKLKVCPEDVPARILLRPTPEAVQAGPCPRPPTKFAAGVGELHGNGRKQGR